MSKVRPIEDLFAELVELKSAAERDAYLDEACGDDNELRGRLEKLLPANEKAGSFLRDGQSVEATVDLELDARLVGSTIGPYKLREVIGEGGMGTVYVAEQQKPLRRKVALKVIKAGMDSKAVIARFEAERNALAMMNHPNIAKVLDAGATEKGRPYFVMELVSGLPITEYCDEHKLTIRERLDLFIQVCQAVQHAHQKAIIHRDLKPSNVLVTELDGKPVPKVIDFGVAKALNQSLAENSIYTSFQSVVGTPLYMSPEQASLSAVDVDTRSDVYSLGALLYELLTGTTPFAAEELRQVAQDKVLQYIREQEPPRPSNRISTLGDTSTQISQLRRTLPDQLGRQIRGDLDWIVMKAMEKQRARRYKSADSLADDVQRHLSDVPVHARPPSTAYRVNRFCRRNRIAIAVALTLLVMVTGLIGQATFFLLKQNALAQKYREHVYQNALVKVMIGDKDSDRYIEEAVDAGISDHRIKLLRGQRALYTGEPEKAIKILGEAIDEDPDSLPGHSMLAMAYYHSGFLMKGVVQREVAVSKKRKTAEDYLFSAHANFVDSRRGLDDINHYLRSNTSALALAIRADLSAWLAIDGDPSGLADALKDIEAARRILGDTAYILAVELTVNTECIRLEESRGNNAKIYLARAIEVEEQLRGFPDYFWGNFVRATFWDHRGDLNKAENAWKTGRSWAENPWCQTSVAVIQYRRGELSQARNAVSSISSPYYRTMLAPILLDTEDGRKEALDTYYKAVELGENDEAFRYHYVFDTPLLLGERELAMRQAQDWAKRFPPGNDASGWAVLNHRLTRFIADRSSESELLADCESRKSWRLYAHYYIGLVRLSNGNKVGAKESFVKAFGDRNLYIITMLADGYVQRMGKSPIGRIGLTPQGKIQRSRARYLMTNVTTVLSQIERGDPAAAEQLLPLVYDELRKLAAARLGQEKPGQTLQATALVHEAYLRLLGDDAGKHWNGRGHFFGAAAEAMRRILIENARKRGAQRHGGGRRRLALDDADAVVRESDDLLALNEALVLLERQDPQAAQVVKLRYFAGLTMAQVAEALGVSLRTAERNWTYARTWLRGALSDESDQG